MPDCLQIGPHRLSGNRFLAPMAGVTDAVFRGLCAEFGANLTFSEMITSDTKLWSQDKTQSRLVWSENEPIKAIQLAGSDPQALLAAGSAAIEAGATWIDINMGCPMKKVCKRWAGSALMAQPKLVAEILSTLCKELPVPITLKTRTGSCEDNQNVVEIAKIAEDSGIQLITIHGRTREQRFSGSANYDLIAEVKQQVNIPVIANGDIETSEQVEKILEYTKADGVMIGRAALGQPWLFAELNNPVQRKKLNFSKLILQHLEGIYELYGSYRGVRIARKHIKWYTESLGLDKTKISHILKDEEPNSQIESVLTLLG